MNIAMLGGYGQLGSQLARSATSRGHNVLAPTSAELDITDAQAVNRWVKSTSADAWINAAAYTAVDAAEDEPRKAHAINEHGARHLAEALNTKGDGAPLVYLSTDYVFSGHTGSSKQLRTAPYVETDATDPQCVYGASKLAGEHASQSYNNTIVLRISWVFGQDGHNFVKSILRAARRFDRERSSDGRAQALRVVDDQYGAPCGTPSISRAVLTALEQNLEPGTYHFANAPHTNWHDFATAIVEEALGLGLLDQPIEVLPQPTSALNQRATRPADGRLDADKLGRSLDLPATPWIEDLRKVLGHFATLPSGEIDG